MSSSRTLAEAVPTAANLPEADSFRASSRDIALLALFGIGQFAVGFLLFTAGARLIPAAETSLIGMIETVLGPLWVWLALGGTVLLAAGILLERADTGPVEGGRRLVDAISERFD